MTQEKILQLQKQLNYLGYGPLKEDGQYGDNTKLAYSRYLDDVDPSTITVVPESDVKWWMSKSVIGTAVSLLVMVVGFFGYQIDSATLTQLVLSIIPIVASTIAFIGTIKRKGAIDKVHLNPFNPDNTISTIVPSSDPVIKEYDDPRGSFKD